MILGLVERKIKGNKENEEHISEHHIFHVIWMHFPSSSFYFLVFWFVVYDAIYPILIKLPNGSLVENVQLISELLIENVLAYKGSNNEI